VAIQERAHALNLAAIAPAHTGAQGCGLGPGRNLQRQTLRQRLGGPSRRRRCGSEEQHSVAGAMCVLPHPESGGGRPADQTPGGQGPPAAEAVPMRCPMCTAWRDRTWAGARVAGAMRTGAIRRAIATLMGRWVCRHKLTQGCPEGGPNREQTGTDRRQTEPVPVPPV
jgi:hypothetical protein